MRLVDAEEGELHPRQRLLHRRRVDRLRRDHHQADVSLANGGQVGGALLGGAGRIDSDHRNAGRLQLAVLILDEGQQRRYDQCRAFQHQGGELIGQRLTAAGRHDGQRVATRQHRLDDLRLPGSKVPDVEDRAHLLERPQQPRRGRRRRLVDGRCGHDRRRRVPLGTMLGTADHGGQSPPLRRRCGSRWSEHRHPARSALLLWEILYRARGSRRSLRLRRPGHHRRNSVSNSWKNGALTLAVQPNYLMHPVGKPLRGPSQTTAALQRRCGLECREPRALQTS